MKSFAELAAKYQQLTVHGSTPGSDISGMLVLAGSETMAHLSSAQPLDQGSNEKGWFDLALTGPSGMPILLRNALLTSFTDYGLFGGAPSARNAVRIYPNLVLFNDSGLSDRQVRAVRFSAGGMEHFFAYPVLDRITLGEGDVALHQALKVKRTPSRGKEPFNPRSIYVRQSYNSPVKFRSGDARFRIDIHCSANWQRAQERFALQPLGTILFDEPVALDTALERVWEWRRFFSQIAFQPLPLTGLAASGTHKEPGAQTEIYIPSSHEKELERDPLAAVDIPFNSWRERGSMQRAMQGWYAHQTRRDTFRGLVSHVIGTMHRRIDAKQILTLCAAIESLDELSEPSTLSGSDLRAIIKAAREAASARMAEVDPGRIASALAMLQRPSLAHRLNRLGENLPMLAKEDMVLLIRTVQRLRNSSAHGHDHGMVESGLIAPATIALAAACVLFDLTSSGISVEFGSNGTLKARKNFTAAMVALRNNGRWT